MARWKRAPRLRASISLSRLDDFHVRLGCRPRFDRLIGFRNVGRLNRSGDGSLVRTSAAAACGAAGPARNGSWLDATEVAHAAAANNLPARQRDDLMQRLVAATRAKATLASAHLAHRMLPRPADITAARALAKTSLIVKRSPSAMRTRGSDRHNSPPWLVATSQAPL